MSTAPGPAIIDDKDPAVRWSGVTWNEGKNDRQFGRTCKFSRVAGANGTLSFSGTSLTVYGSTSTTANASMTFRLDSDEEVAYNVRALNSTPVSPPAFFHHQVLWQSPKLNDTEHTLVITQKTNLTEGQDSVICPDFFTYVPSESAITANTSYLVDDQDSRVKYSGSWITSVGERNELMNQTGMFSAVTGSSFELEFEGAGIQVYGAVYRNQTEAVQAELKLDDGSPTTFAPPEPTDDIYNQQIFQASNLPRKTHKLTGSLKNSGLFIIDYFLIQPGDPNAPPPDTGSGRKTPAGAIAGGVVGGLALVVILLMVFWWLRRRKRIHHQKELEAVDADLVTPYPVSQAANLKPTHPNQNTLSPLRMAEVEPGPRLSSGKGGQMEAQTGNRDLSFIYVPVDTSGSEVSETLTSSPYTSPSTPLSPHRPGEVVGPRPLPDPNNPQLAEHVDSGLRFREGDLPPPRYTQE
ncbi:hypothetical protein V5O48_011132 [Marasmius crinis-equi]|uniref:Epidermal growth factor receptor-like transmembrane-juxtamembrane segment domain-containing protein n=1 Tax=Marasmius crinis-equi TaxID=585013 RepID=A0ABR3F6E1_9AGAR